MLQQTQVATVIDYYRRFLARFPNVVTLAGAEEQEVLALWAGLGYYRRARQLHAAAQVMATEFGGEFPSAFEDILKLPGVGRYTAGAIASFAFDQRAPVLEANTIRLFSRLLALRDAPSRAASQRRLWEFAEQILPRRSGGSGEINQAVMELGSLICTPKQPDCDSCPVARMCPTFELGLQSEIPRPNPKKAFVAKNHALVVIWNRGKVLMRRNPPGQWWDGLWDFPRTDVTGDGSNASFFDAARPDSEDSLSGVRSALSRDLGLRCVPLEHFRTIKHGVTRFRISLFCYRAEREDSASSLRKLEAEWRWVDIRSPPDLPLTSTAEKLRRALMV